MPRECGNPFLLKAFLFTAGLLKDKHGFQTTVFWNDKGARQRKPKIGTKCPERDFVPNSAMTAKKPIQRQTWIRVLPKEEAGRALRYLIKAAANGKQHFYRKISNDKFVLNPVSAPAAKPF
jgi:hypothetical protein